MQTTSVDGILFEKMIRGGLGNIIANEQKVNDMNVFPVPDGDTGTNMRLTLENGVQNAKTSAVLCDYVKQLADGALLGARGNSGVIFSMILKGFGDGLSTLSQMDTRQFFHALVCGYKVAYASVANPVEGTILTVAREGTEKLAQTINNSTTFEQALEIYLTEMQKSLQKTPERLPILKAAGVVDSGAFGLVVIIEGMLNFLSGKAEISGQIGCVAGISGQMESPAGILRQNQAQVQIQNRMQIQVENQAQSQAQKIDIECFTESSTFLYGYCMEFLLRLMSSKIDVLQFSVHAFTSELNKLGQSVVCVQNGTVIKTHIHVFKPAPVIELAQKYGEFLTFKLENMALQHNENFGASNRASVTNEAFVETAAEMRNDAHDKIFGGNAKIGEHDFTPENHIGTKEKFVRTNLAVITVAPSSEIAKLLGEFVGVTVLDGGKTMNSSTEDFVNAINAHNAQNAQNAQNAYNAQNAEKIVIMPNSKNIFPSAELARNLCLQQNEKNDIVIIPTKNVTQSYWALAMDDSDLKPELRIENFEKNAQSVETVSVAKSIRNCEIEGVLCIEGQFVSYHDGKPICCNQNVVKSAVEAMAFVSDIKNREVCFAFCGKNFTDQESLRREIGEKFPNLDVQLINGAQETTELIIGVV